MTGKAAPYSKAVRACALDCLDGARHRLLVFVGPKAWSASKWYLGLGRPQDHREGYVLVLPPDQTTAAAQYSWPVARRAVVIVDTGAGVRQLEPLVDALRRDRAQDVWWYEVQREFHPDDVEFQLQFLHWGGPVAPMIPWQREETAPIAA